MAKKITNFLHKWFLRESLTEDVSFYSLAEVQLISSSYLQRFSGRISRRMGVQNPVILDTHAVRYALGRPCLVPRSSLEMAISFAQL
jgi:hypothetical protein